MATRINTAVPDRASLFLVNLIQNSPETAARSLLAPDSLSPDEKRDFVDRVFGEGESFGKSVARFFSSPITILGFALATKWPAPALAEMAPTIKSLANYDRYMPAALRFLGGAMEIFHNTGVDDAILYLTRNLTAYQERFALPGLGRGLDKFAETVGRLPNAAEQVHMGWAWDMQASREKTVKYINRLIEQRAKRTGLNDMALLTEADLEVSALSAPQKALVDQTKTLTIKPQYQVLQEAEKNGSLPDLHDALAKRGTTSNRSRITKKRGALPAEIDEYFPHQLIRDRQEIQSAYEKTAMEMLDPKIAARMNVAGTTNQTSGAIIDRLGNTIPDAKQARILADAGLLPKKTADTLQKLVTYHGDRINGLSPLAQRDLRMVEVVRHHTDALGRAYVWTVKRDGPYTGGLGKYMKQKVSELTASGPAGQRLAVQLANNYIPAMLGRSTTEQYMKNVEWGALREFTAKMLESPKTQQILGSKLTATLTDANNYGAPWMTWHGASGKAASWLYLSTLGLNPAPAAQNLFQNILTTGAIVKPKYMLQGLSETWSGFQKVMKLQASGMTEREAVARIFPEFHAQGLTGTALFEDTIRQAAGSAAGVVETQVGKSVLEKTSERMLRMFALTERFNHLLGFTSARAQALAEGLGDDVASQVASKVTKLSQAWAGEFSVPSGLQNVSPAFRQYLSFPAKYAGFVGMSAAGGFGIGPGGAFNPGTLGRAMMGSMAAYEAGRGLMNTDLSQAIMFGALPGPEASGAFAPLPLVPPIIGAAGSVALDIARGEFRETPKVLPLLAPGGLQAARLLPLLGDRIVPGAGKASAQFLGRPYAAWEEQTPDGRVPVYDKSGQLLARMSAWQISSKAAGFQTGAFQDEQSARRYLIRQRDTIRDYRRQYIQAMLQNDVQGMQSIDLEYQRRFKSGPIQIKSADRKAAQIRQVAPQIERIISTLPPATRPLYASVVSGALANTGTELFGADPLTFAVGTPLSRRRAG